MPFDFTPLPLPGLVLVTPRVFTDARGLFIESYRESDFMQGGVKTRFVQDNCSVSRKGVLRGLHFQRSPKAQAKLVGVAQGAIWDVAVDLRRSSSHYLRWFGVRLDDENRSMLFIPEGFAHGFAALSDNATVTYKCSREYDPALDSGIRWNDPQFAIDWPVSEPTVSFKDASLPFWAEASLRVEREP